MARFLYVYSQTKWLVAVSGKHRGPVPPCPTGAPVFPPPHGPWMDRQDTARSHCHGRQQANIPFWISAARVQREPPPPATKSISRGHVRACARGPSSCQLESKNARGTGKNDYAPWGFVALINKHMSGRPSQRHCSRTSNDDFDPASGRVFLAKGGTGLQACKPRRRSGAIAPVTGE